MLAGCCVLCRGVSEYSLCPGCLADLPRIRAACRCCGIPLSVAALCGQCQRRPPHFDTTVALYEYSYPLDRLIAQFKYRAELRLATPLAGALLQTGAKRSVDAIIPVPLHWRRQAMRGYNQALLLARVVGSRLETPVLASVARRTHATPAQVGLGAKARRRNLRGAFILRGNAGSLQGKAIAIVDDVITTGDTTNEYARVLKAAGVAQVTVWALARAALAR